MASTLGAVNYINPPQFTTSWENPAVHPFNRFFGGVALSPEIHPYDAYDEATWTLPDALRGKSKFLGQTFELLALMQNSFLLTVILPLVRTDEIQSHWSRFEFPATIPDLTPHLGVVRFVKSNRISGQSTMARYGIGIFLEHGFMNTPEGILSYMMNIRQINAAITEGMQLEVLQALVSVGDYEGAMSRKIHSSNTTALASAAKRTIDRELFAWGCLQQNANAWPLLDKHISQTTALYNRNPFTHYITSIKVEAFLRQIPNDQVVASIYGPDAQRKVQDGIQDFRVEGGKRIYFSRPFLLDENPIDPLERKAQIGEYIRCFNHSREQISKYETAQRTQLIYDENANVMSKITLRQKLDHCYRFDKDGYLLNIRDARNKGDFNEANATDFLHRRVGDKLETIRYMGQMNPKDFKPEDYDDFKVTFFNALLKKYGHKMSDYETALRELRNIIKILGTYGYDATMDAWLQLVARKNTGVSENIGPNKTLNSTSGDVKNNIHGSADIPTRGEIIAAVGAAGAADIAGANWVLPPTHGDYGGFETIRYMIRDGSFNTTYFKETYGRLVDTHLPLFNELADAIHEMLPGAVPASPNFVHTSVHHATHRHALFENMVSLGYNPRYLFLHIANPDPALRLEGNRVERGTARASYVGQQVGESAFPLISKSRNAIMSTVIGNMEVSPSAAQGGNVYIGETIAYDAIGQNAAAAPIRFSPIQTPANISKAGNTTRFVQQRFGPILDEVLSGVAGGAAENGVDFNASVASPTLTQGQNNPDFDNAVYDTIVRWAFLQGPTADINNAADFADRANFYALHSFILFLLAMTASASENPANFVHATYLNFAAVLDVIQEVVGVKFHNVADPDASGRYDAARSAMQDPTKLERLSAKIVELYDRRPGTFNTRVTRTSLLNSIPEVTAQKQRVIATANRSNDFGSLNRVDVEDNGPTRLGYAYHRNANLSLYKAAPISLGRKAMMDYATFAYQGDGIRRAIPASFRNPATFMSNDELNIVRVSLPQAPTDSVALEYIREVGSVFAPESIRDIVDADITMLPLVSNARSRAPSVSDIQFEERENRRRIVGESTVTDVRSSRGLQSIVRGATSSNKRRRIGDTEDVGTYERSASNALPGVPASEATFFKNEQLTNEMTQMYKSLVKGNYNSPAALAIVVSYLFTPFTKQLLDSTIKNDLDHPVDYLVVRPHATYSTVGVISMIPGLETGQMNFGHIVVDVGDDAAIQAHLVTVTHYQGPLIRKKENIYVMNDVLITGYDGGLGTGFINVEKYNPSIGQFRETSNDSIMVFMISRYAVLEENAFCLSGTPYWIDRQGNAMSVDRLSGYGYDSSDYYNAIWGFSNVSWNSLNSAQLQESKYLNQVVIPNGTVFKSTAWYRDPISGKWIKTSGQSGHFKDHTVGQGMHRARVGEVSFKNIPINPLEHDVYF
jgi:hypothetical protein